MGILTDEMKQVVRAQRLAFVATVCADGTPNVSPKGTATVWDDDHLVFADIDSPGTIANLRRNPAVEINIVDVFTRKGFRFKGTATVATDGELLQQGIAFYQNAGMTDAPGRIRAIVLVRVATARPLISPGYARGVSEAQMRAQWKKHYLGE